MSNFYSGVAVDDLTLVRTSNHTKRWEASDDGTLKIVPRKDSDTYTRSTTHFTLNSTVQDHAAGNFSAGRYAVIGNLMEASKVNTISGLSQVDTWLLPTDGFIKLPNATVFAPEGDDISHLKGVNVVRYNTNTDIGENYKNLTSKIEEHLNQLGIPVRTAQPHGWLGGSFSEKEHAKVSKTLGYNSPLDVVHSSSKDGILEDKLSDSKKLINYIAEDNFSVNELGPNQQASDLKRIVNEVLGEHSKKAQKFYKPKVDKIFNELDRAVESWINKKYPEETINNKFPNGFPKPLGNSTATPPPIPRVSLPPSLPSTLPPIPNNMPVDTPLDMVGQFSEWTPNRFSDGLTPHQTKDIIGVYEKHGGRVAQDTLRQVSHISEKTTHQDINTKVSTIANHTQTNKDIEKNSISNFFSNKIEIKSFDTETTGLDTDAKDFSKRAKIYELGLATSGIDGVEEHVNPFFVFNKDKKPIQEVLSKQSAETRLKLMNGGFSLKAHEKGNFNELLNKFPLQLETLDSALEGMFENVKSKDVIVLQNMNFENKILKSSYDQGLISKEIYEGLGNRMNTVSLDKKGDLLHLFERPSGVQEKMREADMIFNTEYLFNRSDESFQKYRNLLNQSMEIYHSVINDPNRQGAVAVELMDVTKAFMANAADKGLLSKEASTLGLNMDFLMQAMSLGEESHTALQDAKDTITVYNKLSIANQELLNNNISNETTSLLTRITESQPKEVNKRFVSTVRSVLSDFNIKGNTKLSDRYSWYSPEVNLREGDNTNIKLDQVLTKRKQTTTNLNDALLNALDRYSIYNDDLDGFNRKEYVDNLLKNNTSATSMYSQVDSDYFKGVGNLSNNNGMTPTDVPLINNKQSATISEEVGSKLTKKHMGLAALGAGLAFMAFQGRPEPIEKNYDNVSQQFYDDQYLGTAFVDFRERNKHYMM